MTKTILLTGATDGIGLVTAEKLVALGHRVLIHGRSIEKLAAVKEKLTDDEKEVESYQADLSDLYAVKQLAEDVIEKHKHLDVLINNAGVYKMQNPITKDNFDSRFVVNTLAPYLLTQKLLPLMSNTSRIINLSSAAQAPVDLKALVGEYHLNDEFNVYAQSKLAITMWSRHLANDLGSKGPVIIAVNPGSLLASKMVKEGFGIAGNDINIGADILLRTSLDKKFTDASGLYFDNDVGQLAEPHVDALDDQKCEVLVKTMERLLSILS
jgi:NAD(P)-dependent dehydrogenase (short-subunit alcohol dehydrogenase family)